MVGGVANCGGAGFAIGSAGSATIADMSTAATAADRRNFSRSIGGFLIVLRAVLEETPNAA